MTVDLDPQRTRDEQPRLIHAQALDRGAPGWGQSLHAAGTINPTEMFAPALGARMKQGDHFLRVGVTGRRCPGFAQITGGAGQAQVRGLVSSVGSDMLHMQGLPDQGLTRLTVFTTAPCAVVNQADGGGPRYVTHGGEIRRRR
jgi:hypothetical protein